MLSWARFSTARGRQNQSFWPPFATAFGTLQHRVPKLSWSGKYHIQMSFRYLQKTGISASEQQFSAHLIFVLIYHHFGDPVSHRSDPISTQKPPVGHLLGPICKIRFWISSRRPPGTHGELEFATDGQIQAYSHIYRYGGIG